ncbi:MAG: bifunctional UDP-sugar hydrolase/5'-nucleotidase [Clostridia bacterium]
MKRTVAVFLVILLLLPLYAGCAAASQTGNEQLTLLFTHDMHSHLEATVDEQGVETGGMTKLAALLEKRRTPDALLVDAGDFSMGTLYQTLYETNALELSMLGYLGYDAVTFGNHEFDYRDEGLAHMLEAAVRNAQADPTLKLPQLVASNIAWKTNATESTLALETAFNAYGGKPYTVLERGGVRVGVFGILGLDAQACAPLAQVTMQEPIEAAKQAVAQLKAENVDFILCLSHGGTWSDPKKSEDELLAKAVPEIDVIVSGHTHTALAQPILVGSTVIASSGEYCQNLGEMKLTRMENGRWALADYRLLPLDQTIAKDTAVEAKLAQYRELVNQQYLSRFGYTFDQLLANNPIDFGTSRDIQEQHGESTLGNLLSDAYVYAVKQAEGESYVPVDLAVTATGIIRGTFATGKLTVSDVFNVCSLGIGPDRVPGYPLVSIYLTGAELKTVAEVDASISAMMEGTVLFSSGCGWRYNVNRLPLNRATEVWVYDENGQPKPVEEDRLYRAVANLYLGQMLGMVNSKSFGLMTLTPKDEQGKPITDFETRILHDQNGNEMKEWACVAAYLSSFPKVDGLSSVPQSYAQAQGRKLVESSANLGELLKAPNKIFWIALGAVALVILLLTLVIVFVVKRVQKSHKVVSSKANK